MPTVFKQVFIRAAGHYMPGEPINNDDMDTYIAPLSKLSGRIKKRILAENGIETRHYAISAEGKTIVNHSAMAAKAIHHCLTQGEASIQDVGLLAAGSSGGDAILPGFADMIQGELSAPPMETHSSLGVCASGVKALMYAAQSIALGSHEKALVVASEMPSRLFKKSRFEPQGYNIDFGTHFLRWMLSDGAGAVLLDNGTVRDDHRKQRPDQICLKLKWIHHASFAGDFPVCMQMGLPEDGQTSYLDYDSCRDAEAQGALSLRQDIRLLPHLFDVSIHEYAKLCKLGYVDPQKIDHFLCHYSSEKFAPVVEDLLNTAELSIPKEKWFTNLAERGNTGAASIFIMLSDFLNQKTLTPGETILCFIPESGRISAAYMLLEVATEEMPTTPKETLPSNAGVAGAPSSSTALTENPLPKAPHDPTQAPKHLKTVLWELASVWQDYRSALWRTPIISALVKNTFSASQYLNWMEQWIPQVREGTKWMRTAVSNMTEPYQALGELISTHAGEEQDDFMILYDDYVHAGGTKPLAELHRNPGGESLNTFLHQLAQQKNPVGLLGAIYIIEGTGQRIVPTLLPFLRKNVDLPNSCFRFLEYHGHNDEHHLQRWLNAVDIVLRCNPAASKDIIKVAKQTAFLYHMQFDYIMDGPTHD